jgi:flagellar basal-body rod protein FlgB
MGTSLGAGAGVGTAVAGRRSASSIDALDRALTRVSVRGELLANNLANINTPGYKRLDLVFEDILAAVAGSGAGTAGATVPPSASALRPTVTVTSPGHIAMPRAAAVGGGALPAPQVTRASGTSLRNDGNNVDIEAEMALLAENSLYYQALVREMNNRLSSLRLAITEGRR